MNTQECRSCHAPVDWAEKFPLELNDKGLPKIVPVDAMSAGDPKGTLEVWRDVVPADNGHTLLTVLYFRYLKKGEEPKQGHHRGVSHFATCPHAGKWRES